MSFSVDEGFCPGLSARLLFLYEALSRSALLLLWVLPTVDDLGPL